MMLAVSADCIVNCDGESDGQLILWHGHMFILSGYSCLLCGVRDLTPCHSVEVEYKSRISITIHQVE